MKLKKLFFILTQISLLTLFSGNSAHATIDLCKGPVPMGVTGGSCSSCHTGSPRSNKNYNGACDAVLKNNTSVMGNSGMGNAIPVIGVGMTMGNKQDSMSFRDKMEMDMDEGDDDGYKHHDKKDRDHKMKREHKKKDHDKKDRDKKDRRKKDRDDRDDD